MGIDGVTVVLIDLGPDNMLGGGDDMIVATTNTTGGGLYDFGDLPAGNYLVDVDNSDPELAGLLPSTTEPLAVVLNGTNTVPNVDFGFSDVANKMASIGDTVFEDLNGNGIQDPGEAGLANVTVSLYIDVNGDGLLDGGDTLNMTDDTNTAGIYEFTGLMAGDYLVVVNTTQVDLDGYSNSTPTVVSVLDLAAGEDEKMADFGFEPTAGLIEGIVFDDVDGDGIYTNTTDVLLAGVTVTLTDLGPDGMLGGGDDTNVTTTTGANGEYTFGMLSPGTYVVDADNPAGTAPTTGDPQTIPLGPNEEVDDADFGYEDAQSAIDGIVFGDTNGNEHKDGLEMGIDGVTVVLIDLGPDNMLGGGDDMIVATTNTTGGGLYDFGDLPAGNYLVDVDNSDPELAGLLPSTTEPLAVVLNGTNTVPNVDFGFSDVANKMASIGDTVFEDLNGNGIQDPGEAGLANVTVSLYIDVNGDGLSTAAIPST